jgi:hypothetical protein
MKGESEMGGRYDLPLGTIVADGRSGEKFLTGGTSFTTAECDVYAVVKDTSSMGGGGSAEE